MNNIDFTKGKLFPSIIKFSLPLIFAIVLQALYGAVDLIVVGQFGSPASQAAVATGGHVLQTLTGIITGFTMGITVIIGRIIGSKKKDRLGHVIFDSIVMFGVFALVVTAVMMGMASLFVKWLHVPDVAAKQCKDYILICSLGSVFIIAYNVISGIFRGMGNSNLPLVFIAIACVVNIVLDFVFVAGLKMDAAGAALATVIAQLVSVVCSLVVMVKKRSMLGITKQNFKFEKGIAKNIIKIGTPIALQDGLVNMSFLIIHSLINAMGVAEAAGVGIAEKLFVILSIVPMALLSTLATVVSQNDGAGLRKRTNIALCEAIAMSFVFGLATFLFTYFGGEYLVRIFTTEEEVISKTISYLKSSSFEYLLISITFCMLGYFNGKGEAIFVMLQGLISTFAFRIPLSYYFSRQPNANMYLMGLPITFSSIVALALCLGYFVFLHFANKKKMEKAAKTLGKNAAGGEIIAAETVMSANGEGFITNETKYIEQTESFSNQLNGETEQTENFSSQPNSETIEQTENFSNKSNVQTEQTEE